MSVAIPPCSTIQMCPAGAVRPASQTPIPPVAWLCVDEARRAQTRIPANRPGADSPPPPAFTTSVPELRARQQAGALPPPCRGAACSARELIDSISLRFRILYQGVADQKKMANGVLLVLLAVDEAQALADVGWLLEQHADYSGAPAVMLSQQASKWLGHPRGVLEIDRHLLQGRLDASRLLQNSIEDLAALVKREKLGAPPAFATATLRQMQTQFEAWIAKAADPDTSHALLRYSEQIRAALALMQYSALPGADSKPVDGKLRILVLARHEATALNRAQFERFPGLIVAPGAQDANAKASTGEWKARELTTRLREAHKIEVELLDLQRKPVPPERRMAGSLLVAGVQGNVETAHALASSLLRALTDTPAGHLPLTLLQTVESLPLPGPDAKARIQVLSDTHLAETLSMSRTFELDAKALLDLIAVHSFQEPIAPEAVVAMGHQAFHALASARVQGLPAGEARQQGNRLLALYSKGWDRMSQLHVARWKSIFNGALKALDETPNGRLHVLLLPFHDAEAILAVVREAPELMEKLLGRMVVTRVETMRHMESLMLM